MILFKGNEVKLKSGVKAEIIEIWGVARIWCRLKTIDGTTIYAMAENVESIISRDSKKAKTADRVSPVTPEIKGDNQMTLF